MTTYTDQPLLDALANAAVLALPELALAAFACLLFLHGMLLRVRGLNWTLALFGLLTAIGLAGGANWIEEDVHDGLRTAAPLLPSSFASFVRWLTLAVGVILLFLSTKEASHGIAGEYYGCLFLALAGCSLLGRANDLVTLFIALELISIPTYVLLYLPQRGPAGQEAAAKYFLLSILSSAILLFGLSHLYGLAGTTNLTAMVETLAAAHRAGASPMAVLAMVLVVAGLSFRLAAVPFHYYAPDVYQGGPTAVVAQLAIVPKIAGFVVLVRLLGFAGTTAEATFDGGTQIPLMLWVVAAITMTLGNVMALVQDNLKRLLAYSGIAHSGYMLLGLVVASAGTPAARAAGLNALLVYLVAYALMTLGTFAVLAYVHHAETVDDLAGLGRTHPVMALCLAVSLLSLIGLPLTAGFAGKLLLFLGLIDSPVHEGLGTMNRVLAVITAVNAALGAVYYLRLLAVVYLRTPLNPDARGKGMGPAVAAFLCAIGTLAVGLYPKPLVDLLQQVK